ncbi:MAG TPA: bacillithiol biosynthesis cysteine-adding enzyme BshC [Candidatus Acidoferrales bacterium]|nr:bacillithiol biosynthesis cysteine-adding enzyme BshC [Candidatus Acidoferrales bacterium]
MHCSCVRQTDLPNTTRLFADVLYHPDRTAAFYPFPIRDLNSYRAAAQAIDLPADRRNALIAALQVQNPAGPALDRLARPGTVAVVTGQQVGLFSGPCYTIYKVLHAVKLAAWLTENGIDAVPLFWLATEDHDFAEVNHAWVFDAAHRPRKIEMRRSASEQPVGDVTLTAPPVNELRAAMEGLPFADDVAHLVQETYRAGSTMGQAFGALLRRLIEGFDVLYVDPMLPAFRELAAPTLRAAGEAAPALTERILRRNRDLTDAGYHAQVHVEDHTSFVFLLENGKRLGLRRTGQDYVHNSRRFTSRELMDRAASLSPNAILRPVIQDSMLPTVAYIGGPAEIAYLAQSEVVYRTLLGRMPVAVPRTGFTVLDARSEKLMARYALTLGDFFQGETTLRERMASRLIPPALSTRMLETTAAIDTAVSRLYGEMRDFDPTLGRALEHSSKKIRYQIDKMAHKAGREAMRREDRASSDASYLSGLIYPERHLQERLYSVLPLLAQHGLDLVTKIYDAIELDCPDHRLMVV